MEWKPILAAPFDRDLELAVIGERACTRSCFHARRILGGWIDAKTKQWINVDPTHWREWQSKS